MEQRRRASSRERRQAPVRHPRGRLERPRLARLRRVHARGGRADARWASPEASAPFDVVVHACGSGGTAAGVALGASRSRRRARACAPIAVCDDAAYFETTIERIVREARAIGRVARRARARSSSTTARRGPRTASRRRAAARRSSRVARASGLVLDPVYTGKAMHGLARRSRAATSRGARACSSSTRAGCPGLLAQGDTFARGARVDGASSAPALRAPIDAPRRSTTPRRSSAGGSSSGARSQFAATVFARNATATVAVQAALAEWGAGRMAIAWSDPLAPIPSWQRDRQARRRRGSRSGRRVRRRSWRGRALGDARRRGRRERAVGGGSARDRAARRGAAVGGARRAAPARRGAARHARLLPVGGRRWSRAALAAAARATGVEGALGLALCRRGRSAAWRSAPLGPRPRRVDGRAAPTPPGPGRWAPVVRGGLARRALRGRGRRRRPRPRRRGRRRRHRRGAVRSGRRGDGCSLARLPPTTIKGMPRAAERAPARRRQTARPSGACIPSAQYEPSPPTPRATSTQEDFLFHLYRGSELLQENRVLEAKEELEFGAHDAAVRRRRGRTCSAPSTSASGLYPRAIQIYEALEAAVPGRRLDQGQPRALLPEDRAARAGAPRAAGRGAHQPRAQARLGIPRARAAEARRARAGADRVRARRPRDDGQARDRAARSARGRRRRPTRSPAALDEGVRAVAETAFSELDAGELRFALAEPGPPQAGDGDWHTPRARRRREPAPSGAHGHAPAAVASTAARRARVHETATARPPPVRPAARPRPRRVRSRRRCPRPTAPSVARAGAATPRVAPVRSSACSRGRRSPSHDAAWSLARVDRRAHAFAARLDALRVVAGSSRRACCTGARATPRRPRSSAASAARSSGSPATRSSCSARARRTRARRRRARRRARLRARGGAARLRARASPTRTAASRSTRPARGALRARRPTSCSCAGTGRSCWSVAGELASLPCTAGTPAARAPRVDRRRGSDASCRAPCRRPSRPAGSAASIGVLGRGHRPRRARARRA